MGWTTTGDIEEFRAAAQGFVRSRPDRHTVLLSVTAALRANGPGAYGDTAPLYGWWRGPGGATAGAFVWTPPRPVLLSPMPAQAAAELAGALAGGPEPVPGINGGQEAAEAFAAQWRARTGEGARLRARHRLYRLGELTAPAVPPPGAARVATRSDRELLIDWFAAFNRDIGQPPEPHTRLIDDRLSYGGCTLWEAGGRPVALAGATRTLEGTARVAPVYTPPELRGRGYASAVTTAVTRGALAAGAREVLLFTDLANPTSNALYQRLGYRPVEDHVVLDLGAVRAD